MLTVGMDLTLEVLVDLAGPIEDESRASEKLREMLRDDATDADVETLMTEALSDTEQYHNRALQDIINNIGERLGFTVEYGVYKGTTNNVGYDGLWTTDVLSTTKTHLVVETKKTATYTINPVDQPGKYMSELAQERGISEENIYGLIVVGEDELDSVVNAVRGSRYRDQVRTISSERLLELMSMLGDSNLRHEQVAHLLLPTDMVDVGSLVELITDVVSGELAGDGGDPPRTDDDFWSEIKEEFGISRNGADITFNENLTGADNLANFVEFLFDRDYIAGRDLPFATGSKRYLINTVARHSDGSSMHAPRRVREDVWIETHSSTSRKKL